MTRRSRAAAHQERGFYSFMASLMIAMIVAVFGLGLAILPASSAQRPGIAHQPR